MVRKRRRYGIHTDIDTLYEAYLTERTRIVSRYYQRYRKDNKFKSNVEERSKVLNRKQFETEILILKEEGYKGSAFSKAVKDLVSSDIKYSEKQNKTIMENLNSYIEVVWLEASNRNSAKGRLGSNFVLDSSLVYDSGKKLLIDFIISQKGETAKLSECKLQMNDVVGQSYYFQQIYDIVLIEILNGNGEELYKSK